MAEFLRSLTPGQVAGLVVVSLLLTLCVLSAVGMFWDVITKWQRKAPEAPPVPRLTSDPLPLPPPASDIRSCQYIFGKYFVAECVNGGEWQIQSLDLEAEGSYFTDTVDHATELLREFDRFYHWKKVGIRVAREMGLAEPDAQ